MEKVMCAWSLGGRGTFDPGRGRNKRVGKVQNLSCRKKAYLEKTVEG